MTTSVTIVTSLIEYLNGSRCVDYSGTSKTSHYYSGFLSWYCNETEGSCFSHLAHCWNQELLFSDWKCKQLMCSPVASIHLFANRNKEMCKCSTFNVKTCWTTNNKMWVNYIQQSGLMSHEDAWVLSFKFSCPCCWILAYLVYILKFCFMLLYVLNLPTKFSNSCALMLNFLSDCFCNWCAPCDVAYRGMLID